MSDQNNSESGPAELFAEAVSIMHRLRAPGGCPWDREQTFDSLQRYTLEETYEVFDAIDRRDWRHLCEELGDLLLQVLFYAEVAAEAGHFTLAQVVEGLNQKLVRRHPHVFTEAAGHGAIDSAQVLRNWEKIKQAEKAEGSSSNTQSALDAISRALPALLEARKLGGRACKVGFDWPEVEGLFEKIEEETAELKDALAEESANRDPGSTQTPALGSEAIAGEIGDLLFTTANLARRLNVDPEFALRRTNAKFRRRFAFMEAAAVKPLEETSLEELDALWNKAKETESIAIAP